MGAYGMGLVTGAMSLAGGLMSGGKKGPDLNRVNLDPVTKGQDLFLEQGKNLPQVSQTIQEANDLSTDMFRKNIAKFAPDVEQTNQAIGANAEDLLSGKVPLHDTMTGFNGAPLTARDLGITSDDLMTSGLGMANASLEGARALSPFNTGATESLLTPGALLSRDDAHAYQLNDLKNQQALIRAKAAGINPIMSGISAGMGNLMGGMGGMGGGAAGGAAGAAGGGGGGIMSMLGGMF